jgi:signal peptide peptidase SppA
VKQALANEGVKSLVESIDANEINTEEKVEKVQSQMKESLEKASKDIPPAPNSTIAWADSFDSQGSYLLASVFDQVYIQPSGGVPLTGVSMQIPFAKRALDWLGVKVYADARKEYKSMIATYTQAEGLTPAQLENSAQLAGELARGIAHCVGVNRFPDMEPEKAADHVSELTKKGPFSAKEALEERLITGIKYKSEAIKDFGEEPRLKTLASYSRIMNKGYDQLFDKESRVNVAIVYLQGTISNAPGEYSTSSVIRGLKEAGEDKDIDAIVLRIDSGGGDVVASDSIWDAVRRVQQDSKKPVIASFGNVCASGGYYASAGADAILAGENTITGSIGVASLRPTLTRKVFDRVGVTLQTIFTGSKTESSLHELSSDEKARQSRHIDETYDSFLDKVCEGRMISRDVIGELAGGRVWTGLAAWERRSIESGVTLGHDVALQALLKAEEGKAKTGKSVKKATTLPDKMVSKSIDWATSDITQEEEMSTIRVRGSPTSQEVDSASANISEAVPEVGKIEEGINLPEPLSEQEADKPVVVGRGIVAPSVVEEVKQDDEGQLAAAAHEAAEASRQDKPTPIVPEGSESADKMGPYGHGLVDYIGGVYTAGNVAARMAVNKKVLPLIEEGMTLDDATAQLYPTAPTEILPDGKKVFLTDVRMIKYPKEKSFGERIRDINRKGDQPSLSLLPGFGNVGLQLRELITDVAVQVLVKAWRDPAMVQRMIGEVEKEKGIRMEYQSGMRL